jgi:hypothetical protein
MGFNKTICTRKGGIKGDGVSSIKTPLAILTLVGGCDNIYLASWSGAEAL